MAARELKPCGTTAAYKRHLRRGERTCAACRRAQADDIATRRADPPPPRVLKPCGSQAAYERHLRRRERPCFKCRVAHAAHIADYMARKRAA